MSELNENTLDASDCEETDLTEIFTTEEIDEIWNNNAIRPNPLMFCAFGYFPEEPIYRQCLGRLLTHRVGQIIRNKGFKTEVVYGQGNGVDLKVRLCDTLVLVAETKNYNIKTKLSDDIIENVISNLNEYPHCKKYFIYSQMANKEVLNKLSNQGISILEIGYQILPEWFYNSIDPRYRLYRSIDSKSTSAHIEEKLSPILQSLVTDYFNQVIEDILRE